MLVGISDKGRALLEAGAVVQVEFILMATKVMFSSRISSNENGNVSVALPTALISVERRKNARYPCREQLAPFLNLSIWSSGSDEYVLPPIYLHQEVIKSYIKIADISADGLCAVSRFPAMGMLLKRGVVDEEAKLVLPMSEPIPVKIEVRWVKRIKEHVDLGLKPEASFLRSFRFGISFINPTDQLRFSIRQFTHQLAQADAI